MRTITIRVNAQLDTYSNADYHRVVNAVMCDVNEILHNNCSSFQISDEGWELVEERTSLSFQDVEDYVNVLASMSLEMVSVMETSGMSITEYFGVKTPFEWGLLGSESVKAAHDDLENFAEALIEHMAQLPPECQHLTLERVYKAIRQWHDSEIQNI